MLIIMAIDAKVFPVGTVGRIIPAVAIFMVHGKKVFIFIVKLSGALGTYEPVKFEGCLTVTVFLHLPSIFDPAIPSGQGHYYIFHS